MSNGKSSDNPYASPAFTVAYGPRRPAAGGKHRTAVAMAFCTLLLVFSALVWLPIEAPGGEAGAVAVTLAQAVAARLLVLTLEFLPLAILVRWWSSLGGRSVAIDLAPAPPAEPPKTKATEMTAMEKGAAIGGSLGVLVAAVPMTACLALDAITLFSTGPETALDVARLLFIAVFALAFLGTCAGAAIGAAIRLVGG